MIYITGSEGQLGREFEKILGSKAEYLNRSKLDLENIQDVKSFLNRAKISVLINTAAFTMVDQAEVNRDRAKVLNCDVPSLFSEYSKTKNFKFIHYSTDYVFNGKGSTPYLENSSTEPLNYYGLSKLMGEQAVLGMNPKSLIFRTSWVYSTFGKNFIKTILTKGRSVEELKVVFDQIGTLTSAKDLAENTLKSFDLSGLFHFSNEGVCSWYDVAYFIKKQTNYPAALRPILTSESQGNALRPKYSVLDKGKIKAALNISIPHWTESLELCLKELS